MLADYIEQESDNPCHDPLLAKQEVVMTTTTERPVVYEVRVWDYDAAPDADGYYLAKRRCYSDKRDAFEFAYHEVDDLFATGARVYCNEKVLLSLGLIPDF